MNFTPVKDFFYNRNWVLWSIILAFGLLYFSISFFNHYYFRTFCYDYGVYNNAFYDYAHFRINRNPVLEPPLENFLQIHLSFTLILLSPFYWLFGWLMGTYTLLFLQVFFILLGGYGVYLLVKLKSNNYWLSILALFHFFIIWGHFSAISADYIDTTVAASVVPLFLYFFEKRKFLYASLCFIFILIAKENMPLWLIFISLTLILIHRKDKKLILISIGYIAFSLFYFLLAFKYLIPLFEDTNRPYWGFAYSALGNNIKESFLFILNHPIKSFLLLFENHSGDPLYDGIKAEFYTVVLLSGGVLVLFRPQYLIMFIPIIAQKMYNDHYLRWGINSFYSIEVVSILTVAIFYVLIEFKKNSIKYILAIVICLSTLGITYTKLDHRISLWYDSNKSKENFIDSKMYQGNFDVQKVYKNLEAISPDAKVCASENIVPHLAFRSHIHCFPYVREADFIVLLLDHSTYPLTKMEFDKEKNKYLSDKNWIKIIEDYPLLILKKKSNLNLMPN